MDTRTLITVMALGALLGIAPRTAAAQAQAQARGFAIDRYEPSERGSDWFVSESLDFRGNPLPAAGLVFEWAYRPLVLHDRAKIEGDPRASAITDQVVLHAGGAVVLRDRVRIGADLPMVLVQDGEDLSGISSTVRSPDKAALGDPRISGDVRILGAYGAPMSAAVGAQLHLPAGSRSLFTSDGTVRVTPRLLVAGGYAGVVYAAKLGFAYRPLDATFEGRALGSEAIFAVAAGVKVNDRFVFGPELYGSTVVSGRDRALRTRNSPLELLLGGHVTIRGAWRTGAAIGHGLTRGDGSPSMRVVLSVELVPDFCVDPDGDGICSNEDVCPNVDGVRENHGCPADRDHDGVVDTQDGCMDVPGVVSDDPAKHGCPEPPGQARETTEPPAN